MVWEGSYKAGRSYDGCGGHGLNAAGLAKDIGTQWNPVWFHDINDDIRTAIDELKEEGVYA